MSRVNLTPRDNRVHCVNEVSKLPAWLCQVCPSMVGEDNPKRGKEAATTRENNFLSFMYSQLMGLLHQTPPNPSPAWACVTAYQDTRVPPAATSPAVWRCRDGASSSLHAHLSCPGFSLRECPHPKLALRGVPGMPSSTAGWGGGRVGHISGTQRIPSMGTSEIT